MKRRAQQYCSAAIASAGVVTVSAGVGGGGVGKGKTKNQQQSFFQTWQIQHRHIELRNESQVALLAGQNSEGYRRQSCHKGFVISPKLERSSFIKKWQIAAKAKE
jgi:hypothetical protein